MGGTIAAGLEMGISKNGDIPSNLLGSPAQIISINMQSVRRTSKRYKD